MWAQKNRCHILILMSGSILLYHNVRNAPEKEAFSGALQHCPGCVEGEPQEFPGRCLQTPRTVSPACQQLST